MGPFSLLTNPAAVVEEKALGVHLGFQPGDHDGPIRFLGYSDPGDGLFAAGAFVWLEGGKAADSKWRQLSYHIGRFLTGHVAVGAAVKHIRPPRDNAGLAIWDSMRHSRKTGLRPLSTTTPLGGRTSIPKNSSPPSPTSREGWGFSVEMGTPLSSSDMSPIVAWVLDLPLGPAGDFEPVSEGTSRTVLGRNGWRVHWDLGAFLLEASAVWAHERPPIYRIGVRLSFASRNQDSTKLDP